MEKHKSIIHFLDIIRHIVDSDGVELVDYWDGDLCAIGLKREDRLVYICTYPYIDLDPPKFDCDLEIIDLQVIEKINVVKEMIGINEDDLIKEMSTFLGV